MVNLFSSKPYAELISEIKTHKRPYTTLIEERQKMPDLLWELDTDQAAQHQAYPNSNAVVGPSTIPPSEFASTKAILQGLIDSSGQSKNVEKSFKKLIDLAEFWNNLSHPIGRTMDEKADQFNIDLDSPAGRRLALDHTLGQTAVAFFANQPFDRQPFRSLLKTEAAEDLQSEDSEEEEEYGMKGVIPEHPAQTILPSNLPKDPTSVYDLISLYFPANTTIRFKGPSKKGHTLKVGFSNRTSSGSAKEAGKLHKEISTTLCSKYTSEIYPSIHRYCLAVGLPTHPDPLELNIQYGFLSAVGSGLAEVVDDEFSLWGVDGNLLFEAHHLILSTPQSLFVDSESFQFLAKKNPTLLMVFIQDGGAVTITTAAELALSFAPSSLKEELGITLHPSTDYISKIIKQSGIRRVGEAAFMAIGGDGARHEPVKNHPDSTIGFSHTMASDFPPPTEGQVGSGIECPVSKCWEIINLRDDRGRQAAIEHGIRNHFRAGASSRTIINRANDYILLFPRKLQLNTPQIQLALNASKPSTTKNVVKNAAVEVVEKRVGRKVIYCCFGDQKCTVAGAKPETNASRIAKHYKEVHQAEVGVCGLTKDDGEKCFDNLSRLDLKALTRHFGELHSKTTPHHQG